MDEIFAKPRWPIVPPLSNRTLYHPSFLPVYMAAAPTQYSMNWHYQAEVPLITPFQFFYADGGRRIHNTVTDLRVFECYHLNTPPPVMSAFIAPPNRPDPFRAGSHPTRSLGSPTRRTEVGASLPPAREVIQLSQEEDQAITTLLKLRYKDPNPGVRDHGDHPANRGESPVEDMDIELSPPLLCAALPAASVSAKVSKEPICSERHCARPAMLESERCRAKLWSDVELEAANTLLTLLSLIKEVWPQSHRWNQCRRSRTSSGDLQNLLEEGGSPGDADSQPTSLISADVCYCEATQKYVADSHFDWLGRLDHVNRAPLGGDGVHVSFEGQVTCTPHTGSPPRPSVSLDPEVERGPGVFGGVFRVREGTLAESEGTAVVALLSLGDVEILTPP